MFLFSWDYAFDPLGQLTSREHHQTPAPQALQADIRANAQYLPFEAAAGMGLAKAHDII